jgi:hypothetical protein
MKKLYSLITLVILLTVTFKASAQDGIDALFKGSPDDVNKLLNAYTAPLFKGFGNSLNGGWTNTAKPLGLFKFNIRVSASVSMIPEADKSFNINSLGLTYIKPVGSNIAQTFGGDPNAKANIQISDPSAANDPNRKYSTTLPGGVTQYVPAPQVQLTVGLIKNTDVTLRLIPTTKITDDVGSVGMFGVGVKHSISQYFGKAEKVIPFDLAFALGYTRLTYKKPLTVRPENNSAGNVDYSTQALEGNFSGWNAQVIISKKLLFFTPFVSVGFLTSKTDVGLKGNYPFVTGVTPGAGNGTPQYTAYANPITISGSSAQTNGMRADVGFQMSLFFLKIYGSYSFAEYKSANVGIGLGF